MKFIGDEEGLMLYLGKIGKKNREKIMELLREAYSEKRIKDDGDVIKIDVSDMNYDDFVQNMSFDVIKKKKFMGINPFAIDVTKFFRCNRIDLETFSKEIYDRLVDGKTIREIFIYLYESSNNLNEFMLKIYMYGYIIALSQFMPMISGEEEDDEEEEEYVSKRNFDLHMFG